ncbi:MAG: rane protein [Nocardioides sp.]|jgi:predicted cobalt transporter CbtA|nr:rane protein [Nocardioides sp.]
MTARSFLVRGLLIGLLAGLAAFLVAHEVGEPHVEAAVALEEATASHSGHASADAPGSANDEEHVAEVSRPHQRTWGLLTGTLAIGTVLGGLVGLLSASVVGRLGRLTPVQSTLTIAAIGFVSYSLVPFLKYPATPPGVGSGDTIDERTNAYFGLVLLSVLAALGAVLLARAAAKRLGGLRASVTALVGYVAVVSVAAVVLPSADGIVTFPADLLWSFRLSSLLTLAAMWAVIGIGLALVVDRLATQDRAANDRRALAASL